MKQIIVVAENADGLFAKVTKVLADNDININTIDAESIDHRGVLILTVDQYDQALQVINQLEGLSAISEDAIVVRIEDKPGALAQIGQRFRDAKIGIRSLRIIHREQGSSLVAISTNDTELAQSLVKNILVSPSTNKE